MQSKAQDVLWSIGTARGIGLFSWPVEPSRAANASPGCSEILGAEVTDCESFGALLQADDAAAFASAVASQDAFRLGLTLADGRLVEITAHCTGEACRRVVDGTIEDISHRRAEIDDLTAREELCRAVAENSPAMLWMGDQNGKCVFLNQAQRDFWGVDPQDLSTFNWGETTHPNDLQKLAEPFVKAMAEQVPFSVEARYRRADGEYRTLRTQARPRFDLEGRFLGMTGVNTDITDQLRAEEHTRLLMGELNHRTKNILSVVQAVARQTARNTSPQDFIRTFGDRLLGLAASNDLLLRNDWTGVDMGELAEAQLSHLADLIGPRIVLSGPPLKVAAAAAQTLGMALHELSTNSLKYGALRNEKGRIDLRWSRSGDNEAPFTLSWVESGAGPACEPSEKGFGHSVIVDMVAAALDAEVDVAFAEDGFSWTVRGRSSLALAD